MADVELQLLVHAQTDGGPDISCDAKVGRVAACLVLLVLGGIVVVMRRPRSLRFDNEESTSLTMQVGAQFACQTQHAPPCLGQMDVAGYGRVSLVKAGMNTPSQPESAPAWVSDCKVLHMPMTSRTYFAQACDIDYTPELFGPKLYSNFMLLGKKFSYSVDLSMADCGCILAMYLVPMHANSNPGLCGGDYYCDANEVCGVSCAEIDIMEASKNVFRSTSHAATDRGGLGAGLGPNINGLRWDDYHPGSACIDTNAIFSVSVIFQHGDVMVIKLSQGDKACMPEFSVVYPGQDQALSQGMTPVLSYWTDPGTSWFDGPQWHPEAPGLCAAKDHGRCGQVGLMSDFSVEAF